MAGHSRGRTGHSRGRTGHSRGRTGHSRGRTVFPNPFTLRCTSVDGYNVRSQLIPIHTHTHTRVCVRVRARVFVHNVEPWPL